MKHGGEVRRIREKKRERETRAENRDRVLVTITCKSVPKIKLL